MKHSLKSIRAHQTAAAILILAVLATGELAHASTYVVYIPLDDPAYDEFETLTGLGVLNTYLDEIKPISRVEAARLILEAGKNSRESEQPNLLAESIISSLRHQFAEEVNWLEQNRENGRPTTIHPFTRIEIESLYSSGDRRYWQTQSPNSGLHAQEGTPLLPYNDGIPTAAGTNEVARMAGWAGASSILTFYGEGAVAGPMTHGIPDTNRLRLISGAAVINLGNTAISFGEEQMAWGPCRFSLLAQGNNAEPFPAIRVQNVHPQLLPGFLKYLGQFRYQAFFGQLGGARYFSHPWIDGQIFSFKPLPALEFGITHTIMFGGAHNDNYSALGFFGRATGFNTGSSNGANTNSRVGAYVSLVIPRLRRTQLYYEILGEDFFQPFGKSFAVKTPFKSPSYTFGIYAPQLTADGLTDARAEYTVLDANYSVHNDSLYWTNKNALMGDSLGSGAWRVSAQVGRWFNYRNKLGAEFFYERRSMTELVPASVGTHNENGFGGAVDFMQLPFEANWLTGTLGQVRARSSVEYVQNINYSTNSSIRMMLMLSFSLNADAKHWNFR
ncbi:MAG: capsule assembly Wzi family protein [Candidatus Binatus sp.]|uniref:capsule assembly Wzi family protein n=1 Tax=Candidatus Binatus sp. TaxID=2811406 RepID=UPI0027209018|nr:capsule assembly Wzi family protein [Candidatus Binatus sp.]MDO8432787.1 capsule assembly Wzi family protein [Candidatus Binatus sp.]